MHIDTVVGRRRVTAQDLPRARVRVESRRDIYLRIYVSSSRDIYPRGGVRYIYPETRTRTFEGKRGRSPSTSDTDCVSLLRRRFRTWTRPRNGAGAISGSSNCASSAAKTRPPSTGPRRSSCGKRGLPGGEYDRHESASGLSRRRFQHRIRTIDGGLKSRIGFGRVP